MLKEVERPDFGEPTIELRSGMAFQVDVIPAMRGDFALQYPEAWSRIERRRAFMNDQLGIRLKPEVLPFSNIPAYLPPFLQSPTRVMTAQRH